MQGPKDLPTKEIELIVGYPTQDGNAIKSAVITPITAYDRRQMGDVETRKNLAVLANTMLQNRLVSFGNESVPNEPKLAREMIHRLHPVDSDRLMVEIRRFTNESDKIKVTWLCPHCEKKVDYDADLDEDVEYLMHDFSKCNMENRNWIYSETNEELGMSIQFRLPRCSDRAAIWPLIIPNPIEAQYKLFCRVVQEMNGERAMVVGTFDRLSEKQIDWVDEVFNRANPHADFSFEVKCPHCKKWFESALDISDFLFGKRAVVPTGRPLSGPASTLNRSLD